ncbi:MAG: hypothetical protein KJZ77_13075 [Anaerolineales bacterium]|nr:hypothetical protein [Anaerolineales bacterium]
MTKIILLDVDGVLVTPGGYRAALHATLNHFAHLMEASQYNLEEEQLSEFEKRGIFSEWDMTPLLIGAMWNEVLSHHPGVRLPANLTAAAKEIGQDLNHKHLPEHLHIPFFQIEDGKYPAESALQQGCFPNIPQELRVKLLSRTRDIHFSETMQVFQQFSLGSRIFEKTYKLRAAFETESLLSKHDVSNLTKETLAKLKNDRYYLSVLTARPSSPPREVENPPFGYAPEAELALELVGLAGIPITAFGKLEYIAAQQGLDPVVLLKPSPFQALAGTLAAWTGDELGALQAAYDWHTTGKLHSRFAELPKSFDLIVVEDTMGGIRSTQSAGEILKKAGFNVTVRPFGLTLGSTTKASTFEKAGVPYYEDWQTLAVEIGL